MYEFLVKNARLSSVSSTLCDIAVEGGRIAKVAAVSGGTAAKVFDAKGMYLVPAFWDMHFHGAGGADFCDASLDSVETLCRFKLAEGVGTIVPATLSIPEKKISEALKCAAEYVRRGEKLCRLPGVHIEGPFLNPLMSGAQNPGHLNNPDIEFVKRLMKDFKLLKFSYAPELDAEFSKSLCGLGIVPSCVHSAATYGQFMEAYSCGLRNISHFGNRLSPITSRDIGATGAGLMHDDVFVEIIADGIHLSDDMLGLILAKKPHSKIALITDSMRASGMPDGEYDLGGMNVFVSDGQPRLENRSLAGSVLRMNYAVKKIMQVGNLPLEDAAAMASYVPAQSLGIQNYGKIEEGFAADFAVLDEGLNVWATIVGGEVRHSKTSA